MQGSASSAPHQRTPACKLPMVISIPLCLSAKCSSPTRLRVVLAQSHPPVWMCWAGTVHCFRDHKFPLCTLNSFLRKGSFSDTPKGKKQTAQQWQVPALSPSRWNFLSLHFTKQGGESGTCPHCSTKSWAQLVGTALGAVGFCNCFRLN